MHTMVAQCSADGGLMNINISQCQRPLRHGHTRLLACKYFSDAAANMGGEQDMTSYEQNHSETAKNA